MSTQPMEKSPNSSMDHHLSGTAINLCLGILYAWSIWKAALYNPEKIGEAMTASMKGGYT